MVPRPLTRAVSGLAAVGAAACDAPDEVQGGEPLGQIEGGEPLYDAGCPPVAEVPVVGVVTYTYLYDSYFSARRARRSCTARSGCHAALADLGAQGSGYVCGATRDSCFAGMTMSQIPAFPTLVPDGGSTNPTKTTLYLALHEKSGSAGGVMPLNSADGGPGYEFTPTDLARIAAWIDDGAQNN